MGSDLQLAAFNLDGATINNVKAESQLGGPPKVTSLLSIVADDVSIQSSKFSDIQLTSSLITIAGKEGQQEISGDVSLKGCQFKRVFQKAPA